MHLTRLEAQGFKSFAHRISFDFHSGVTGIVGPNGCGKSNVVDAIKWALGDMSRASLRSEEMLDVIFKGASGTPATGFAEVTLTFDNADRRLQIDFDEVAVTRRLHRTGESEYLINRAPCRLKDIRELFYGTGLGRESYSIIKQGHINFLVDASPAELRAFIEEAAGISLYKARKREAELKLERVGQDLQVLGARIQEIEREIRSLRVQAGRAERYRNLQAELKEKRAALAMHEYHAGAQALAEVRAKLAELEAARAEVAARVEAARAAVAATEAEVRSRDEALAGLRQQLMSVTGEAAALEEGVRHEQARHADLGGERDRITADRAQQAEQTRQAAGRLEAARAAADQARDEAVALRERVAEADQMLVQADAACAEARAAIAAASGEAVETARRRAERNNALVENQADRRAAGVRRERVVGQQGRLEADHAAVRGDNAALAAELERLDAAIADAKAELELEEAHERALVQEIGVLGDDCDRLREARERILSRGEFLRDLEARLEGLGTGARGLLRSPEHGGGPFPGICGTVADVLHVEPKYLRALENLLAERAGWLVSGTALQALQAVDHIQVAGLGWVGVVPRNVRVGSVVTVPPVEAGPAAVDGSERVGDPSDGAAVTPPLDAEAAPSDGAATVQAGESVPPGVEGAGRPEAAFPVCGEGADVEAGASAEPDPAAAEPTAVPAAGEAVARPVADAAAPPMDVVAATGDSPEPPLSVPVCPDLPLSVSPLPLVPLSPSSPAASVPPPPVLPGHAIPALDCVRFAPEDAAVAHFLLGGWWVVPDREAAIAFIRLAPAGAGVVSLDGVVFGPEGTVAGGTREGTVSILSRRAELSSLSQELQTIADELDRKADAFTEKEAEVVRLKDRARNLHYTVYDLNVEAQRPRTRLEEGRKREDVLARELALNRQELGQLEAQEAFLAGQEQSLQQVLGELEALAQRLEEAARVRSEELGRYEASRRDLAGQAAERRMALSNAEIRREGAVEAAARQADALAEAQAAEARMAAQIGDVERRMAECEAARARKEEALVAVRAERDRLEGLRTEAEAAREGLVQELQTRRAEEAAAFDRDRAVVESTNEARLREQQHAMRLEHIAAAAREECGIDLAEAHAAYAPVEGFDAAAVHQDIAGLRQKIEAMGSVNPQALDDLRDREKTHAEVTVQERDIAESKQKLEEEIRRLNRESRERFDETYVKVREHFRVLFRKLFGGGNADLRLQEGVDPLEAGLEIEAKPPHKDATPLHLLSGGEKTLTTLALVMAIFRSRPAPFCLLDEADAALDEKNVDRYAALVREFAADTQFLVITHNKRTMTCADALYGVTMQTPGVSKRVSVNLEQIGTADGEVTSVGAAAAAGEPAEAATLAGVGAGGGGK